MSDQQDQPPPNDLTPEDVARAMFAAARPADPRLRVGARRGPPQVEDHGGNRHRNSEGRIGGRLRSTPDFAGPTAGPLAR